MDRLRLPAVDADRPLHFPRIDRRTLSNGLEIRAVAHRTVPLVSASLLVRGGSAADPADLPGLTALTGDLLDEGADGDDALAIADAVARIGGELDLDVGHDAVLLTLTMLGRFLPQGLELLARLATRPTLAEGDFDRVRTLRLERLKQLRDHPPALAERAFAQFLYGRHPYGHLSIGTEEALRACRLDDVRTFYRGLFRPDGATLVVAGDFAEDALIDGAAAAFADWHTPADDWSIDREAGMKAPPETAPARLGVIRRPAATQSELRIGHVCASRNTPDFHVLLVLNAILGGQFVSRVNLNLREQKGYTYGVRTSFDLRRGAGPFVLQTSVQTEVTVPAIRESLGEIDGIRGSRPPTDDELSLAQASLTRGYARGFETMQQVARAVAQLALHELPDTYFEEFVSRVGAVTKEDLHRVSHQYLDPKRLAVVIVGDVERVAAELDTLSLGSPHVLI
ncbi:MAG: M16 family metallopeptidase [Vicinamibacterales bacterium]